MQIGFFIKAHENGDHVRAKVRLFIPKNNLVDGVLKGRCKLWVNTKLMDGLGNYWVMGEKDRDLWLPHLRKKVRSYLGFFGIRNSHYGIRHHGNRECARHSDGYVADSTNERHFKNNPYSKRTRHFREFSLDEVCSPYSSEEWLKEIRARLENRQEKN